MDSSDAEKKRPTLSWPQLLIAIAVLIALGLTVDLGAQSRSGDNTTSQEERLSAVLATPRIRNGPTCSRGKIARSSTTGMAVGGLFLLMVSLVGCVAPKISQLACDGLDGAAHHTTLSSHRMTQLDLAVHVGDQVADGAAMFLLGNQAQALVGDAPEAKELFL